MMLGRHFLLVSPYLFRTFFTSNRAAFDAGKTSDWAVLWGELCGRGRGMMLGAVTHLQVSPSSFLTVLILI